QSRSEAAEQLSPAALPRRSVAQIDLPLFPVLLCLYRQILLPAQPPPVHTQQSEAQLSVQAWPQPETLQAILQVCSVSSSESSLFFLALLSFSRPKTAEKEP